MTPNAVIRWSTEAAQRLVELTSGIVDGIDNPGPDDFPTIEANPDLKLYPRTALNVFYVGFNNTFAPFDNEKVRQAIAMGIDRQADRRQLLPARIRGRLALHAVRHRRRLQRATSGIRTTRPLPRRCSPRQAIPDGFTTKLHLRDVVRGYLPSPVTVAQDIQAQLKANLNITAEIDVQDATTYLTTASRGELPGIHLLGWGADYPDVTNFLDVHFGVGASEQFGDEVRRHHRAARRRRQDGRPGRPRSALQDGQ